MFPWNKSGDVEERLFAVRSRVVPGVRCSSSVNEVVHVPLPNQKLQISFVWSASGCEVSLLPMEGAVCSGVRMSFPKLVCWLPEEGLISDLPKEDVDRLLENRGLFHVVLQLRGIPFPSLDNVDLPPVVLGE